MYMYTGQPEKPAQPANMPATPLQFPFSFKCKTLFYYVPTLQFSISCFRLSTCLFNSRFSSLQYSLIHFLVEMKTLVSSSKLVAVQVGMVVVTMAVGCCPLCLTLYCQMKRWCLHNRWSPFRGCSYCSNQLSTALSLCL